MHVTQTKFLRKCFPYLGCSISIRKTWWERKRSSAWWRSWR